MATVEAMQEMVQAWEAKFKRLKTRSDRERVRAKRQRAKLKNMQAKMRVKRMRERIKKEKEAQRRMEENSLLPKLHGNRKNVNDMKTSWCKKRRKLQVGDPRSGTHVVDCMFVTPRTSN